MIEGLQRRGLRVVLLSGDDQMVADTVGRTLGIPPDAIHGDASPEAKRTRVARLQEKGHVVVMVGDGLNDAPALSQADVGIAVESGSQANRFASDIVATRNVIESVARLFPAADQTMSTIRRNLGFSLIYNMVAAGAAVAGTVTPLVAAIAMPVSSLVVVVSSLALRPFRNRPALTESSPGNGFSNTKPGLNQRAA
jgi:P-type E1-E2 ATPase